MNEHKDRFPQTQLFRVEEQFGGWDKAMKSHFASGGELDQLLSAGRG
jgi:sulfate transport system substrate-binding protein